MKNLVFFGPPGAGKGTQAAILKNKYNLVHISTGDIFRFNIKNKTELGKLAQSYMDKGDLVPDKVTIEMLKKEVNKYPDAKGFIFDGFPRTQFQAQALDEFLEQKGEVVNGMLSIIVPEERLIKRILNRGLTSKRPDDQDVDRIKNRFNEYQKKTAILQKYYQEQNKYYGIDGVGSIEEITKRLSDVIDNI